ncbi:MAG: hypothetical protein ACE5J2_06530 [Nitrososphaerales archaeon]
MRIENTSRWKLLFAGIIMAVIGFVILAISSQNLASGSYFSPLPSLGYEDKFLSYSEVAHIGGLMVGVGIFLAIISIGIRRWPRYQPEDVFIDGVKAVGISVASIDYERDKSIVQDVMRGTEVTFHTRNEFSIGEPEFKMGWNFFVLHVKPNLIQSVADYSVTQAMQNIRAEDRFIGWLSEKLKEKECNVYLDLESRKSSSKYGLF